MTKLFKIQKLVYPVKLINYYFQKEFFKFCLFFHYFFGFDLKDYYVPKLVSYFHFISLYDLY